MKIEWTTSELKENLLIFQAVVWGLILLLPGDTFANPSRMDIMSKYAPDHAWGIALLLFCLPSLFMSRTRHPLYRKILHAALWTFWLGIACLATYRSSENGLVPTDFLISIPFFTIALMHGIIYAGLERRL